jgi:hypothetical protein
MRVRALDANGDMTFGQGQDNFLINSPQAVAQNVVTRLALFTGTWFLDTTDGTPWDTDVLGRYTQGLYDPILQARILGTPGCIGIQDGSYTSVRYSNTRALNVACIIETQYDGVAPIEVTL